MSALIDLESLLKKPVAILGAGVSGKAAEDLIESLGGESVVYDERNTDFPNQFSQNVSDRHQLVVASPGFSADHPWLKAAESAGCTVIGELDLACQLWKGRVIAVTGTNGKTTLVEFITHSLRFAGHDAYGVGNIGFAFASLLKEVNTPDSWAVVEVSSFQAELMRTFRADSIVWSNFSEDHLDRYGCMERYFLAKAKLLEVARPKTVFVGREVESAYRKFQKALPSNTYVVDDTAFRAPEQSIFSLRPQRHNYQLAAAVFRSWGYDPEMLHDSVRTFRQSPHRLAPISEVNGVQFWNDSKATNFSSAEEALKHFRHPVFWIGGGRAKGGQIEAFGHRIGRNIKKGFLTGDTASDLADVFVQHGVSCEIFETLEDATRAAFDQSDAGDVVLFSPGFASQKPFRNYSERGQCFESVVSDLKVKLQLTN